MFILAFPKKRIFVLTFFDEHFLISKSQSEDFASFKSTGTRANLRYKLVEWKIHRGSIVHSLIAHFICFSL